MRTVSRTDIGHVRATNQDALIEQHGRFGLYGVADGMGGHKAGDIASKMAVLLLGRMLENVEPEETALRGCVDQVNRAVYLEQEKDETLRGMGTTLTVLWEGDHDILVGHVGDSRAYLWRDGVIRQVTMDHSMVAEMVRDGALTPEEALRHPYRHVITRALGTAETVETDVIRVEKKLGDRWLVCSDGLSEYVTEQEMSQRLATLSLEDAADALLLRALSLGGRDNVTLLLAEVSP